MGNDPLASYSFRHGHGTTLLIACGALGREIVDLIEANGWRHLDVTCVAAQYHHTPGKIPEAVREKIRRNRGRYEHMYVLYGDCGTAGELVYLAQTRDPVLEARARACAARLGLDYEYRFVGYGDQARISHHPSTAVADPLAVTGRTPSSRLDVVSATSAPSSSPCAPSQRRLDDHATNGGEICGLGEYMGAIPITPARD